MENRPSVLKGDHLFVSRSLGADDDVEKARHYEYKGYVHEIHASQVCLGFSKTYIMFFLFNLSQTSLSWTLSVLLAYLLTTISPYVHCSFMCNIALVTFFGLQY